MTYSNDIKLVNWPKEYIKEIQDYLDRQILYWNAVPGEINVCILRDRLIQSKKVLYVPCRYKRKILRLTTIW